MKTAEVLETLKASIIFYNILFIFLTGKTGKFQSRKSIRSKE